MKCHTNLRSAGRHSTPGINKEHQSSLLVVSLCLSLALTKCFSPSLSRLTTHLWPVNQSPRPGHLTVPMTTPWKPVTSPSSPPTVSRVRSPSRHRHSHLHRLSVVQITRRHPPSILYKHFYMCVCVHSYGRMRMFVVLDQWSDRPVNRDATREWSL